MTTLTSAQLAQQHNRTSDGKYTTKTHSEADIGLDLDVAEQVENEEIEDENQQVTYSFLAEFEALEDEFNTDFDGVPKRFFNADLRGKPFDNIAAAYRTEDFDELREKVGDHQRGVSRYFDDRAMAGRLCHAASAPDDGRVDDHQAEALIRSIPHVTDVVRTDNQRIRSTFAKHANRMWVATVETQNAEGIREQWKLLVTDTSHNRMQASYLLARDVDDIGYRQQVTQTDLRSVAGAARIEHLTGQNLVSMQAATPDTRTMFVGSGNYPDLQADRLGSIDPGDGRSPSQFRKDMADINMARDAQTKQASLGVLQAMEDAQLRGKNFLAQKKYLKDQRGSIATAFDDKKNPDATRQQMMRDSRVAANNGGHHSVVEYDNDVDPAQAADFEAAIEDVSAKLPRVPDSRQPQLRVRYLGKHRAKGLYSPAHNAIAVDVRTSEAYIHEMGHYYDFAVKNNASLSSQFRDISRQYAAGLKEPDGKRRAYLNTPTEQFARGFEVYAHQRLGIDNRLLDPSKFDKRDYAPITGNPKLKQQMFDFFDKAFNN